MCGWRLVAEHFCDSLRDKLQWLISRAAERCQSETGTTSLLQPRVVEVVQHLTMCRDRSREFRGRDHVLRLVRNYVVASQPHHQQQPGQGADALVPCRYKPLVLCGESGSGKTSVMAKVSSNQSINHRRTHIRLTALCPGLPGWAGTRKVKPVWILLKQETVSGSGISWAVCKSAPRSRQTTTPAPHHSVFYRPDALPEPTVS